MIIELKKTTVTLYLGMLIVLVLIVGQQSVEARDKTNVLSIGKFKLSTRSITACKRAGLTREELKNLAQYDPTEDPRLDINDESPWTPKEIEALRKHVVEFGFVYPNGNDSVITWMDIDDDGECDFTATVGIGGSRPIDRMMLFRGLGGGKFRLVHSHLSYMDTAITLVPYIPVTVVGESMPLIVVPREGRMLRWREDGGGIAVCDVNVPAGHPPQLENVESPEFGQLCEAFLKIADWAEQQLPRNNRIVSWR